MIPQQMRFDDISDEYARFVDKFKPKKTTDDCYTPEAVFDAVCYWVESEYNVSAGDFVRPFWPGGDYERFDYQPGQIVVDNPPFSILSRICEFYEKHGIKYFLFAPYLTNFSIRTTTCHIITDIDITYENGAIVNTSFVTNLERTLVRTAPELGNRIDKANAVKRPPPKPVYKYPDCIITPTIVGRLSRAGVNYSVQPEEAIFVSKLDAQRPMGKSIYGGGFMLSLAAEQAFKMASSVEVEKTREIKKINVLQLSQREKEIQKLIGWGGGKDWISISLAFTLHLVWSASCRVPRTRMRRLKLRRISKREAIRIS